MHNQPTAWLESHPNILKILRASEVGNGYLQAYEGDLASPPITGIPADSELLKLSFAFNEVSATTRFITKMAMLEAQSSLLRSNREHQSLPPDNATNINRAIKDFENLRVNVNGWESLLQRFWAAQLGSPAPSPEDTKAMIEEMEHLYLPLHNQLMNLPESIKKEPAYNTDQELQSFITEALPNHLETLTSNVMFSINALVLEQNKKLSKPSDPLLKIKTPTRSITLGMGKPAIIDPSANDNIGR